MKPNRHALIFSTVWPEPDSSAAGVRQMQWISLLLLDFDRVTVISSAKIKKEGDWGQVSLPPGVEFLPMPLNDWQRVEVLKELNPELVLFDRFILEEQFGPLVYEAVPDALVLVETQDLHLLRRARESVRGEGVERNPPFKLFQTDTAIRETAALERADFSFVVSSYEERLLDQVFGIGSAKQAWVPFFYQPAVHPESNHGFDERFGFVWIGNFRHAPNTDGLRWFRREIWPRIRVRMPGAKLRIYGAYPSEEFISWNRDLSGGIEVKGAAKTLEEVFSRARVNLAPLRFGAGIKGKILEGFRYGVPAVSTWIGAEGLRAQGTPDSYFPGAIADDPESFSVRAVELHQEAAEWEKHHVRAMDLMKNDFCYDAIIPGLRNRLLELLREKREGRLPVWRSRILRHELMNSRKYFSKWIEAKEKLLSTQGSEEGP